MQKPVPHSHDHGAQGHDHLPEVTNENEGKILTSFLLIFLFMLVEAVGGVLSGSLALLADAGHMLSDAVALGLSYLAFRLGRRAADGRRSYGYARLEVVAGFVNALTLFAVVVWILWEAAWRLQQPQPIIAGPMFWVAVVGLLVNLFVLWYLTRGDSDHVNVRGAVLHVLGDLLGSVGAIVAAIVIWLTGWTPIDPLLSVFVSVIILRAAWGLLRSTLHILLEGAPNDADADEVVAHLKTTVEGVRGVRHVHLWSITSGRVMATLQVEPKPGADIRAMLDKVEKALHDRFGIDHATIGLDWTGSSRCALAAGAAACSHAGHTHG